LKGREEKKSTCVEKEAKKKEDIKQEKSGVFLYPSLAFELSNPKPIKIISSGAQYVTLQKCFHIQVSLFTFLEPHPAKLKLGP